MFRCMKPGCPVECGCRNQPSCADRLLYYGVLGLLTVALCVSLGMGVRWFGRSIAAASVSCADTQHLVAGGSWPDAGNLFRVHGRGA